MQIRPYVQDDIPQLLKVIRSVYDQNVFDKAVRRFKWQYQDNPKNTTKGPVILVLEDNDKIIGMIGAFAQSLKIGDNIYPAFWVGDYMVHPEFRGIRYGLNLAKQMFTQPGLLLGFPAESTINLWLRIGAKQFCQLSEYSRKIHYFERIRDLIVFNHDKGIQITEIKSFDHRFDQLWEKASKDYKAIQVRDSRFLNWRFFACPHVSYRVFAAAKSNEVLGFIVVRDQYCYKKHEGIIVDIFAGRTDSIVTTALLRAGINALTYKGCKFIKMTVSSHDKFLIHILLNNSFKTHEITEHATFSNNINSNLNNTLLESSNWFLTKADSDQDFS